MLLTRRGLVTGGLVLTALLVGVAGLVIGLFLWNASRSEDEPPRSRTGAPPRSAEY